MKWVQICKREIKKKWRSASPSDTQQVHLLGMLLFRQCILVSKFFQLVFQPGITRIELQRKKAKHFSFKKESYTQKLSSSSILSIYLLDQPHYSECVDIMVFAHVRWKWIWWQISVILHLIFFQLRQTFIFLLIQLIAYFLQKRNSNEKKESSECWKWETNPMLLSEYVIEDNPI